MSLLEIRNLEKKYGDKKVIDNLSFSVNEGDILGFLGPNGAGKSTTINIISTILDFDSGEIDFEEKDLNSDLKRFKENLGIVPQDLAIFEDLSAYDNVRFFCSLYGYKGKDLTLKTEKALQSVGLLERKRELPAKFSGGMKKRLNIACSIAHNPKLLIMDEPTVGIDPQSRNYILETVKSLNRNGTTVIYTSHYMEEVEVLCNKIIIMDNGHIIEEGQKEDMKEKYEKQGFHSLEAIFLHLTGKELRDKEN